MSLSVFPGLDGDGNTKSAVARSESPLSRRSFVNVMSLSVFPGLDGDGNTKSARLRSGRTDSSTSSAALESGARCSAPPFIRNAGMRHSWASKSISAQVAPRASPDRQAVNTTNRRHAFADTDARDASMTSSAAATSR